MFKIFFLSFVILLVPIQLFCQALNLKFDVIRNDSLVGGFIDVNIQVASQDTSFDLGTSNFVFKYDPSMISFPTVKDSGMFGGNKNYLFDVTSPESNLVSINIELIDTNNVMGIRKNYLNLVTLQFEIFDMKKDIQLTWRTKFPNAVVAFSSGENDTIAKGYFENQDIITKIVFGENEIPKYFALYQNYPNPFNSKSVIKFAIPQRCFVTLEIYDLLGKKLDTLIRKKLEAGYHTIEIDGSSYSSGVYFYRLFAGEYRATKKMIVIK